MSALIHRQITRGFRADHIYHFKPNDLNTGAASEDAVATAPMMK
ncbi:MAG: hypothetical protein ACREV9_10010 [Burkholderiales bacterium]